MGCLPRDTCGGALGFLAVCRMALFHEEEYEGAKDAFETAKGLGSTGEVNRWLGKCNAELEGVLHSYAGSLSSM